MGHPPLEVIADGAVPFRRADELDPFVAGRGPGRGDGRDLRRLLDGLGALEYGIDQEKLEAIGPGPGPKIRVREERLGDEGGVDAEVPPLAEERLVGRR